MHGDKETSTNVAQIFYAQESKPQSYRFQKPDASGVHVAMVEERPRPANAPQPVKKSKKQGQDPKKS